MRVVGALLLVLVCAQTAFGAEGLELETVVVTAKKVETDIQDVSMSLSVLSGQTMTDTRTLRVEDLADLVPNLSLRQEQGVEAHQQRITIRGVGAYSRNIGFDTRAGVYLDGVYMGQSPALNAGLFDLERVEVLRGPQGTLYGKNTVAGAVNLISKKPQTALENELTLEAGDLEFKRALAVVNIPLIEGRLFTRLTALYSERDGAYTNLFNGRDLNDENTRAFRLQALGLLGDVTALTISMDGFYSNRDITLGDPLTDTFVISGDMAAPDDFDVSLNTLTGEDRDVFGLSATLSHDLEGGFTINAISGFRDTQIESEFDLDHSSNDIYWILLQDGYQQATQEIRLHSPPGRGLSFLAGLYLSRQDARTFRVVTLGDDIGLFGDTRLVPGNDIPNSGNLLTWSYAGFFNGEYHLTEKLGIEAGFRYTRETKDTDYSLDGSNSGLFNIAVWDFEDTVSTSSFTPSAGFSYEFNQEMRGYFNVATGFKSGGFNLDYLSPVDVAAGVAYDKETVLSYEAGLKLALPARQLRAALSVFQAKYRDYQVQQLIDLGGGAVAASIKNAAKVTSRGVEFEVDFKPADRWSVNAGVSLLDAEFDAFPGGGTGGADASGNELPFAPHFTAGIGGVYEVPVASPAATLSVQGNYFHTDGYYTHVSNVTSQPLMGGGSVPYGRVESYGLLSGKVALNSDSGGWSIYAWGKNLLDKAYITDSSREFTGMIVVVRGMPRTFGLGVAFRF